MLTCLIMYWCAHSEGVSSMITRLPKVKCHLHLSDEKIFLSSVCSYESWATYNKNNIFNNNTCVQIWEVLFYHVYCKTSNIRTTVFLNGINEVPCNEGLLSVRGASLKPNNFQRKSIKTISRFKKTKSSIISQRLKLWGNELH